MRLQQSQLIAIVFSGLTNSLLHAHSGPHQLFERSLLQFTPIWADCIRSLLPVKRDNRAEQKPFRGWDGYCSRYWISIRLALSKRRRMPRPI